MTNFIKKHSKIICWMIGIFVIVLIAIWSQGNGEWSNEEDNTNTEEIISEEDTESKGMENEKEEDIEAEYEKIKKERIDMEEDLKPVKIPEYKKVPEGMPEIVFIKQDRSKSYNDKDFNNSHSVNIGLFIDKHGNIKEFCFDDKNQEYGESLLPYLEKIGDDAIVRKLDSKDMNKLYYYYEQLFRVDPYNVTTYVEGLCVIRDFMYYGFISIGNGAYNTITTYETANSYMEEDGGKSYDIDANAVRINLWLGEVLGRDD